LPKWGNPLQANQRCKDAAPGAGTDYQATGVKQE